MSIDGMHEGDRTPVFWRLRLGLSCEDSSSLGPCKSRNACLHHDGEGARMHMAGLRCAFNWQGAVTTHPLGFAVAGKV